MLQMMMLFLNIKTIKHLKIQKIFRGRSGRLASSLRADIAKLPEGRLFKAAAGGLDGIGTLICEQFGKNVWQRAVVNAPEGWEEEQMVFAMRDILSRPKSSNHMWLLAKPTKVERMMMTAFSPTKKVFAGRI